MTANAAWVPFQEHQLASSLSMSAADRSKFSGREARRFAGRSMSTEFFTMVNFRAKTLAMIDQANEILKEYTPQGFVLT